jgi:hypothetical protein
VSGRPDVRVVVTFEGDDDVAANQASFHRAAGLDVLRVAPGTSVAERADEARRSGAHWLLDARPGEFWLPRGGSASELLAAVPPRFGVVYGARHWAGGVERRRVVRAAYEATSAPALHSWLPFDVLSAPPQDAGPASRRSPAEEVALAIELARLDAPGPTPRERLDAIEARLARLETSLLSRVRRKLSSARRTGR